MSFNSIIKFFVIFFLAGIIGGCIFGFMLALGVLALYHGPEICLVFAVIASLFYIPGVWRIIKQKTYLVIFRKIVEIIFISAFLTAMFLLEEESMLSSPFDWNVIYVCLALSIFTLTFYLILEEYFNQSWLCQEINHIINGMQMYGLLKKEKQIEKKK
jgi:hypothetical protein